MDLILLPTTTQNRPNLILSPYDQLLEDRKHVSFGLLWVILLISTSSKDAGKFQKAEQNF